MTRTGERTLKSAAAQPRAPQTAHPDSSVSTRVLRSQTNKRNTIQASSPIATRTRHHRRANANPPLPKRHPPKPRKPHTSPPTHFTCRICIDEKPTSSFPQWVPSKHRNNTTLEMPYDCTTHLAKNPRRKQDPVCKACIGTFMAARHDTLGARAVSEGCLEPGCQMYWDANAILRFFPPGEPLERYSADMLRIFLADHNLQHCIDASCSGQGLPDRLAPGYPQVECGTCRARMCVRCQVPWHVGRTCAEYVAKKVDASMSDTERETLRIMQMDDARRCPNCQYVVVKEGGCDSIFCEACRTFFNWATAASAVPGAKAAVPSLDQDMMHGGYMHRDPNEVCEMDGLNKGGGGS